MGTLLQTSEVAELAHRTPAAVRLAAKMGRLRPALVTGRGQRLYSREDALAWVRSLRKRAVA